MQEVTVFLNGAEIVSAEKIPVKKGRSTIVFKGLSPYVNSKSVQVSVDNVALLSVSTEDAVEEHDARLEAIRDSIAEVTDKLELIHNQTDALQFEKKQLLQRCACALYLYFHASIYTALPISSTAGRALCFSG